MMGGIGFSVFRFWSFLRSVFRFLHSFLISTAVFDCFLFDILFSVFLNKKSGLSVFVIRLSNS